MEIEGDGTLLEQQLNSEGIETEDNDSLQMELLPTGPIQIDDTPLSELGSSQSEMLAPQRDNNNTTAPNPSLPALRSAVPGETRNQSILKPSLTPKPLQTIAPMSYEIGSGIDLSPVPVPRKPLPNKQIPNR